MAKTVKTLFKRFHGLTFRGSKIEPPPRAVVASRPPTFYPSDEPLKDIRSPPLCRACTTPTP